MRDRDTLPKRRDEKPKEGPPTLPDKEGESGFQYWFFMIVPLLLAPTLMACCVLSFLERYSAQIGIALGIIVSISSAMVVFWIADKHKINDDGLAVAAITGGVMGMLLYYQFIIVGRRKEAALWFLLELGGVATAIVCSTGLNTAKPPVLFGLVAQPNNPFPGQRPGGPVQPGAAPVQQVPMQPPANLLPAPRLTGDPWLDRALADMQGQNALRRRSAMTALGNAPINQHQAIVARKLAEIAGANPPEKGAVIILLGRWGTANELPVLLQCLDDPDSIIRKNALMGIGRFQDPRSLAPAVRCLQDPATCSEAEKVLRQLGPSAEAAVLPLLGQKDVSLRQAALRVLNDVGTQQCLPAVQAATTDTHPLVRATAQDALNAITARSKK